MDNQFKLLDEFLAIRIREGDEKTFDLIFKTWYADLVCFANKFLSNIEASEEIVQDVFLMLWETKENYIIKKSIKSYLLKCVQNKCIDYLRHQKVAQKYAEGKPTTVSSGLTVENELHYIELQSRIRSTLEKLPELCRKIFIMNRFDGKKYQEIAEELNISIKVVESQIAKAMKNFRNILREN